MTRSGLNCPGDGEKRKKVGILGGTFDPIHTGHLILAEAAFEAYGLDYVLIMPNGNPPHKPGQVHATMEQRTRMAELAAGNNEHFKVSPSWIPASSRSFKIPVSFKKFWKGFVFFQNFLKDTGILKDLEEAGIQEGDTVKMYGLAFEYLR